MRAAASSIASGMPSSRRQISPTAAALASRRSAKLGAVRARAIDEQAAPASTSSDRRRVDDVAPGRRASGTRPDLLAVDLQRLAARREHADVGAARTSRVGEVAGVVEEVLAVVEHERAARFALRNSTMLAASDSARALHAAQRGRDDLGQRLGVGRPPRELAEPRAVGEARQHLGGDLHREPGLADTADAGERDQAAPRRAARRPGEPRPRGRRTT